MIKIKLIIVESPAKAKTIESILGKNFKVLASNGHIRDLPKKELGVNLNNFEPKYVIMKNKHRVVKEIKQRAKKADEIYLASDPDREGEAIAWHLFKILELNNYKRIEFNEITQKGIKEGIKKSRKINFNRVNAQQARRILDRLVGYKISPVLWDLVAKKTSAGRVQSVTLKIIKELEDKIKNFVPEKYWSVKGIFSNDLELKLYSISDKKIKRIFDKKIITELKENLKENDEFKIIKNKISKKTKNPPKPFKTSTLQQKASKKLKLDSSKTMKLAQQLYEGINIEGQDKGLITYMRTDSERIANSAKKEALKFIKNNYGEKYMGNYKSKSKKGMQDAHEAIRPTDINITPEKIKKYVKKDLYKVYKLIWDRFLCSQCSPMKYEQLELLAQNGKYIFRDLLNNITFLGFMKFSDKKTDNYYKNLPKYNIEDIILLKELKIEDKKTKPPSRFSEADLIKRLEKEKIGRPSTYASIISVLKYRKYIKTKKRKFIPTKLGENVVNFLEKHFTKLMDIEYTSKMEMDLDKIELGEINWKEILNIYYGEIQQNLSKLDSKRKQVKEGKKTKTNFKCLECSNLTYLLKGKYGFYLKCSECNNNFSLPKSIKVKLQTEDIKFKLKNILNIKLHKGIETDIECNECNKMMLLKKGQYGIYISCAGYPKCSNNKKIPQNIIELDKNLLKDKKVKLKKQLIEHIKNKKKENIKKYGNCAECNGYLVLKTSKHGDFLGCSNFPKCKYIKKLD